MSENKEKLTEAFQILYDELLGNIRKYVERFKEIEKEKQDLANKIANLRDDFLSLQRLLKSQGITLSDTQIQDLQGFGTIQMPLKETDNTKLLIEVKEPISPTDYVKKVFDTFPERTFKATTLKRQLEILQDKSFLDSAAGNLFNALHSSLKILNGRGEIEHIDRKNWKKKVKKEFEIESVSGDK